MKSSSLRWAILGAGAAAHRFASDMRFSATGRVTAIGSRTKERATALAAQVSEHTVSGLFEEIIRRDDVNAVYIAAPNAAHAELAMAAISAGKPVLIEKPLAVTVEEGEAIAAAARHEGILAMEAMWMRFTPGIAKLKQLVDAGAIGAIRRFDAGLAFSQPYVPTRELFDPRSGGALLDLGVYTVSLALHLLGAPHTVSALVREAPNGAILSADVLLRYDEALASLSCGLDADGANEAVVTGTSGILRTHRPFFCSPLVGLKRTNSPLPPASRDAVPAPIGARPRFGQTAALRQMRSNLRTRHYPTLYAGTGLHYQADHFADCLRRGLTNSPVMPLEQSIETLRILEMARRA